MVAFLKQNYLSSKLFLDCFDESKEYKMDSLCEKCIWNDEKSICSCQTKLEPQTTQDAKGCQVFCQDHPDCQFWTWNKNDFKCFLKNVTSNETPRAVTNSSVISGPKYCGMSLKNNHLKHTHFFIL